MSRLFASGDYMTLFNTGTPFDASRITVGAWVYPTASTPNFARIIRTPAIQFGYWDGAGGQTYAVGLNWIGNPNVWESVSTNPILNQWALVVAVIDGSGPNGQPSMYVGDLTNAMSSQTMVQQSAGGSSTRDTGYDYGSFGGEINGTLTWPGRIAMPFMVPWAWTLAEAERFRTGNLSALYANGTTNVAPAYFFFDLAGSNVTSYKDIGPSPTLTPTGTTTAADPLTINTTRPSSVVSKTLQLVRTNPLSGPLTPVGTLTRVAVHTITLTAGMTPGGAIQKLDIQGVETAGITPAGTQQIDYFDGNPQISPPIKRVRQCPAVAYRPFRWAAFSQRNVVSLPASAVTYNVSLGGNL